MSSGDEGKLTISNPSSELCCLDLDEAVEPDHPGLILLESAASGDLIDHLGALGEILSPHVGHCSLHDVERLGSAVVVE